MPGTQSCEGPCGGIQCTPDDCGPEPDVARCPGGGGPTMTCDFGPDGECGWQIGRCPQDECGTIEGLVCDAGFFCDYDGAEPMGCGVPDGGGHCRPIPEGCPENEDPVCGCDGNTYSNGCMADMAGVDTQHHGACEGPCERDGACGGPPPPVAFECPDGSFVGFQCAPDDAGICGWREDDCPVVDLCALPFEVGPCDAAIPQWAYNPALGACEMFVYGGCEGNANRFETQRACEARCGGAVEPVSCGGRAGDTCGEGEFCDFAGLGCDWADAQGVCRPRPEACIDLFAPVCGCDGRSYGNECEAHAARTDVAAEGACDAPPGQICGGRGNGPCPAGTFCNFPPRNICGAADGPGTCDPIPNACDDVFAPVCGCDDNTHSNACEAAARSVSVLHEGPCELPELCSLPAVVGDCEAAMPRWFHNAATGQCAEFTYGGCGGNENNFMSREACEGACPPRR